MTFVSKPISQMGRSKALADQHHGHASCSHRAQAQKGSRLILTWCCLTLKFLLTLERGAGHLYLHRQREASCPHRPRDCSGARFKCILRLSPPHHCGLGCGGSAACKTQPETALRTQSHTLTPSPHSWGFLGISFWKAWSESSLRKPKHIPGLAK